MTYIRLLLGIGLLAAGAYLLAGFFLEFAKLIIGLVVMMVGVHLITSSRRPPRVFVRS